MYNTHYFSTTKMVRRKRLSYVILTFRALQIFIYQCQSISKNVRITLYLWDLPLASMWVKKTGTLPIWLSWRPDQKQWIRPFFYLYSSCLVHCRTPGNASVDTGTRLQTGREKIVFRFVRTRVFFISKPFSLPVGPPSLIFRGLREILFRE